MGVILRFTPTPVLAAGAPPSHSRLAPAGVSPRMLPPSRGERWAPWLNVASPQHGSPAEWLGRALAVPARGARLDRRARRPGEREPDADARSRRRPRPARADRRRDDCARRLDGARAPVAGEHGEQWRVARPGAVGHAAV